MRGKYASKADNFDNTMSFLKRLLKRDYLKNLDRYGQLGVARLAEATPKRTGKTAESWGYSIEVNNKNAKIIWTNSNVVDGVNIALIIQYGHGTRNGAWVEGLDYINPTMVPMFEQIANEAWGEVIRK